MQVDFQHLVDQLHEGDTAAAEQIVRDFEPEIRRIVRARLRDPRLRRIVDSMDICQSVFGRFFVQARLGRFELNSQQDLVRLLTRMATNKVIDKHRTEASRRRVSQKRAELNGQDNFGEPADVPPPPENRLVYEELLTSATRKLTADERKISELRNKGLTWQEVSQELGDSPSALRKRLERACTRVSREIGIG